MGAVDMEGSVELQASWSEGFWAEANLTTSNRRSQRSIRALQEDTEIPLAGINQAALVPSLAVTTAHRFVPLLKRHPSHDLKLIYP